MKIHFTYWFSSVLIALALLRPQKANAQNQFNIPFRDCGSICAGNTFEGRDVLGFMENETWKVISQYEFLYEVSSFGNIRSLDRVQPHGNGNSSRKLKGRPIRFWVSCNGYKIVSLSRNGVVKKYPIHKLVCNNFHPNPFNYPCANHKDGDKLNNFASNLEHASYSENNQHAFDTGLKKPTGNHGENIGTSKLKVAQILEIRRLSETGLSGKDIANLFNVSHSAVCRIISKQTWRHV